MSPLKNLPHRNWSILRDLWLNHIPEIDLSASFPEPTLRDLPEVRETIGSAQAGIEVAYVSGARESVFREAIVLARKFSYCRSVSRSAAREGFPTWSTIAAYDACFYGAKAFCYFLGIASIERHSKLFLDIFVPRNVKISKRKSEQVYDVLMAHRLDDHLTHKTLWDITARLCRTLQLPDDRVGLLTNLRELKFDQISNYRNNIVYDGGYWLNSDDFDICDLTRVVSNVSLFRSIEHGPQGMIPSERYFSVAVILSDALRYFLDDIAKLAPAIAPEAAALTQWSSRQLPI